ncbi:EF-P lysine aminoacylase EpmA [Salinisphaera sp. Q1T1-3]|uniref:EF-P lysine aminoacylase EpmA n=1 Tax=Salinisphaera sp. Q1T1-3 TaxID=2321229 RepID=UPI000E76AB6E|nr:EF-P lysine aminoacylase EpmA [Salinisphaera sp. Q1T1-3]RJS95015.1 EF-P lysine aminoacylase GenX [Salinisphaera sp. Q1T1-3]
MIARRAALLAALRQVMADLDVLEIDGAVLSAAAPAERALDCLAVVEAGWLVPSPEHGLKRLLVELRRDCYQLGHVFRAGEHGRWHNPEFTMLEWYRLGASMADAVDTLDAVLQEAGAPRRVRCRRYADVFAEATGLDVRTADTEALAAHARAQGIAPADADAGDRVFWLDLLMAFCVQPTLGRDGPEVITHFPADDAVLVELDPHDPRFAQRFECFWQGIELANGAVELTDVEQARKRMVREQQARRAAGSAVPPIDERLLQAMTAGLPRCAGVALGVDRLLALLTGAEQLADVVPFAWPAR